MINESLELRTGNLEYRELTPEQIAAIRRGMSLGRELQTLHPEIAEDYRNGMFHNEIVEKYDIAEQFGTSEKVAKNAVERSIRGAVGVFGLKPYLGLIEDEEELEKLAQNHHIESGKRAYELGLGIHGMNSEELSQAGKKGAIKGGIKGGTKTYKLGLGIHRMSKEEKRDAGRKAAILRGDVLYTDMEKGRILELHQEIGKGVYRKNLRITQIVNQEFHGGKEVRNTTTINRFIVKHNKLNVLY